MRASQLSIIWARASAQTLKFIHYGGESFINILKNGAPKARSIPARGNAPGIHNRMEKGL